LDHVGALPYAVAKLGLQGQVYSTIPVAYMGDLALRDALRSKLENEDFGLFTFKDIEQTFEKIVTLKYSQHYKIEGV
jgi:cleavage and polyadenylation specificity factor subunit 2